MTELQDAQRMLDAAEQAAAAGDLTAADELLRGAARVQEAELGPLHPDLASTLNNLAVVDEKTGRFGDAETFYRRAVAIASASLPADDPMVAASRENLEAFCRARGLPIDTVSTTAPAYRNTAPPASESRERAAPETTRPVSAPPTSSRVSNSRVSVAIGVVVVLLAVTFLLRRSTSQSRETATAAPTTESAPPRASDRTQPTRAEPAGAAPIEQTPTPAVVPPRDTRDRVTDKLPALSRSPGAITLITAQLCRTFSTAGATWTCTSVGDPVSPGPIVLYTRVRSPRDAVVVHRWYRGDALRQSVKLTIRANATEGYRTYSRQTVDAGADWRVEVRSAEGTLLDERRFAVR
jgi:Protein of unknown function (DUF2914)/Tetratricopeptide repeat